MPVTASEVKALRELTGAGMMECKNALTETDGDLDDAIALLRKKGAASAEKKSGRIAAEGVIAFAINDAGTAAILVELNCETDFVAKDESWIIETKGYIPSHHDFPMRWKLFLKHLSDNYDKVPMVFICRNKHQIEQAIKVIKSNEEDK